MKTFANAATVSLFALGVVLAASGAAQAGCTPGLDSDTGGNTCIGNAALVGNSGSYNTATGYGAMGTFTANVGSYNAAHGVFALHDNDSGDYNSALGYASLSTNLTGRYNSAVGTFSLGSVKAGSNNTAVGYAAGSNLVTGSNNIFISNMGVKDDSATIRIGTQSTQVKAFMAGVSGVAVAGAKPVVVDANGQLGVAPAIPGTGNVALDSSALTANTTGNYNTAAGASALAGNSTGSANIALGYQAGTSLTTGSGNIAIGNAGVAGESGAIRIGTPGSQTRAFVAGIRGVSLSGGQAVVVNANGQLGVAPAVPGTSNVAVGGAALGANTTGNFNTAAGASALAFNTTGSGNTASGASALGANTTGSSNTASGVNALKANSTGSGNTASGVSALKLNTKGSFNIAEGVSALTSNTTGNQNVAVGYEAAKLQTTGSANTAIGFRAGLNWTVGSNNIAIASPGVAAEAKTIRIGVPGAQTRAFMAGIRGVNVTGGQAVVVNAAGQLGVVSSSLRYKQDVQPMGAASDPLMQLRPVTFRYKQAEADGSRPLQYGLIAEEVARAMPGLAIYNAEGQPDSVAYQALPSLLLNEYQKQARELHDTRAELQAVEAELATMRLAMQKLASAR